MAAFQGHEPMNYNQHMARHGFPVTLLVGQAGFLWEDMKMLNYLPSAGSADGKTAEKDKPRTLISRSNQLTIPEDEKNG